MGRNTLVSIGLIAAAVLVVFWQVFVRLVDAWIVDGNYSHGFLIIPIALYFVWERREKLVAATRGADVVRPGRARGRAGDTAGGPVGIGVVPQPRRASSRHRRHRPVRVWLARTCGFSGFPIAFLFLMIPIPAIIFNQIAFPLQLLASRAANGRFPRRAFRCCARATC